MPEASLLPRITAISSAFAVLREWKFVPGIKLVSSDAIGDDLRAALTQAIGPTLAQLATQCAFVRLRIANGALGLTVDGYRADPAELDALRSAANEMAEAMARLSAVTHEPSAPPFGEALPAFDRTTHPVWFRSFEGSFDRSGLDVLEREATQLGLRVEDPSALHRAYACLPTPGTSMGVLAGDLPGTRTFARLTWQTQSHPASSSRGPDRCGRARRTGGRELPRGGPDQRVRSSSSGAWSLGLLPLRRSRRMRTSAIPSASSRLTMCRSIRRP